MRNRSFAARGVLAAGFLLVAGCGMNPELAAPAPPSVQLPPKLTQVRLVSYDHDIVFARGAKTLTPAQTAGLANFLNGNAIRQGDAVTVESSGGAAGAARGAAVLDVLGAYRIHAVAGTDPELAAGAIRVHADHTEVSAPSCPDWSKPEADEPGNTPSSNYGCANEANLAAMIANPADLVKPARDKTADGAALARGVELYRSGNLAKTLSGSSGYSTSGLSGPSGPPASGGSQ